MDYKLPIILASASPRRKQLLSDAGYQIKVVPPTIDESAFASERIEPCEYAERLALAKAKNVAGDFPESLVIGADTLVDFKGEIIGKPANAEEAEQITRKLFGAVHKVITGLAIVKISDSIEFVSSDITVVYPRKMSDEQISSHIKGGTWQGKAGAYAIQETGDEFVEKIQGSLTNVMGMPMELLQKMLKKVVG
jgi:septum formation protein